MRAVRVLYHREDGVWWAESPDVPGFSAAADSLPDVRHYVREALREVHESEPYYVVEIGGTGARPNAGHPDGLTTLRQNGNAGSLLAAG